MNAWPPTSMRCWPRSRRKYKEYGIKDQKPFVIVKPDAGTYGTSILTIKDSAEIKDLTQAQRDKMIVIKDGKEVTDFIIQEGVPTFESIERRGRAGGLHDRPLRGGRLLPHPRERASTRT
jgi:hypothetical protein